MRNLGRTAHLLGGIAVACFAALGAPGVQAQVSYPAGTGGGVPLVVPALPVVPGQPGVAPAGTASNPLHVTGGTGGGGGGDASAANQQSQLAQESAAAAALGAPADAAWAAGPGSVVALLKRVAVSLGAPLQVSGNVGGYSAVAAGSFARPANATAYAAGQLVANATAAGSVAPVVLAACRTAGGTGLVRRVRLAKTGTGTASASFRVHLYRDSPTVANGDGGTWLTTHSTYVGAADVTMDRAFSDGAKGIGTPTAGTEIVFDCAAGSTSLYALLEARAAYAPASGETFTVALEVLRD